MEETLTVRGSICLNRCQGLHALPRPRVIVDNFIQQARDFVITLQIDGSGGPRLQLSSTDYWHPVPNIPPLENSTILPIIRSMI